MSDEEWEDFKAKVRKMNTFNTGYVQPGMYYTAGTTGSAPTVTNAVTWGVGPNPIVNIQGHGFQYDIQTNWYVSVEDNRIKLSPQHVADLQAGTAVLDWEGMKLSYLPTDTHISLEPMPWIQPRIKPIKPATPNSDWLMKEIDRVCRVGSKTLAAA